MSSNEASKDCDAIIRRKLTTEQRNPNPNYTLSLTSNGALNRIHFSCRGPKNTIYDGGIYHGMIILPPDFPFKPPNVQLITPSGRFETNKNLCFSYTSYHPESWSPAIGFGAIILGLLSLFDAPNERGIGMISNVNTATVARYIAESQKFVCHDCGMCHATVLKELQKLDK